MSEHEDVIRRGIRLHRKGCLRDRSCSCERAAALRALDALVRERDLYKAAYDKTQEEGT